MLSSSDKHVFAAFAVTVVSASNIRDISTNFLLFWILFTQSLPIGANSIGAPQMTSTIGCEHVGFFAGKMHGNFVFRKVLKCVRFYDWFRSFLSLRRSIPHKEQQTYEKERQHLSATMTLPRMMKIMPNIKLNITQIFPVSEVIWESNHAFHFCPH